jgi:hypothetical protein
MKSRSIRVALLAALVLTSPLFPFAGGQPAKVRLPSKSEMQNAAGVTPAVQQGKGTGTSRNQGVRGNAWRLQTAEDNPAVRDESGAAHQNWSDSAFRK